MAFRVARSVIDALVEIAALAMPNEACGILFGTSVSIESALPTANVHPTPRSHFEIDPAALIAAHKAERAGGPGIAGYWHSHPTGHAEPSAIDRASAAGDHRVWAIVGGEIVSFWRDTPDGFEPLSYMACPG